jgi:predicted DNA-binding transcriptional regulator AlpA
MMSKNSLLDRGGFMRLHQVLELIPISRSSWYAGQIRGKFPKPIALGPRTRAYRTETIAALIADPENWGCNNDEI